MSSNKTYYRVLESTGSWYKLLMPDTSIVMARVPGKHRLKEKIETNPVSVGDWVTADLVEDGTYIIQETRERTNAVVRTATHGKRGNHIICCNVDVGCIVQSLKDPEFRTGLIDRFMIATALYESSKVCVIINKMDLAVEEDFEELENIKNLYESLQADVLFVSIFEEESMEELRNYIKDKTVSFTGPSGVGKTSLLNALDSSINHKVGEISEWSNKGKHTTTFARLVPVTSGGFIIDTPGIREFGMAEIKLNELDLLFTDFEGFRENCKFYNCTHIHEPGCSVTDAVESGEIAESRYKSYISMFYDIESKKKKY